MDVSRGTRAAAGALAILVISCDNSPTSPNRVGNLPTHVVRLEIAAPSSVAPGQSAQLTARAFKSDNTIQDVTSLAEWTSSEPAVVRVSPSGLATAVSPGEVNIAVRHHSQSASARVLALPTGTFKLTGLITDTGFPVAGARVEVTSGTGSGLATTTDGVGGFVLFGVAGRITLHARRDGYRPATRELDVSEHATHEFEMVPDRARTNLSGTYELTFRANNCSRIPESVRTRTYAAIVEQQGPALTVTLQGASFIVSKGRGDRFSGFVDPANRVVFAIGDPFPDWYYYFYYQVATQPDIAERLSASTALVITGRVEGEFRNAAVSGRLGGWFMIAEAQNLTEITPSTYASGGCFSVHDFDMRRR